MYSSIFVNFLIYVHICSSQIVFLFPLTVHTAKCVLMLSYPITPAIIKIGNITSSTSSAYLPHG